MASSNCLVNKIKISIVYNRRKKFIHVWNNMRVSEHFQVNYPFIRADFRFDHVCLLFFIRSHNLYLYRSCQLYKRSRHNLRQFFLTMYPFQENKY
ncbi:Thymidylate synthase [Labeo rohita]|uniref:Thymidylate synthase n=1 Tax=Labeo rohita TaxID=84645 RepID=A0ABQ8LI90_LABRO|nr:Thymidylate synthase [Labeo rohita]